MKRTPSKTNLFRLILPVAGAAAFFLALPNALLADEVKQGIPEKIEINIQAVCPEIQGLDADKKKVSNFSHALHAEKYLLGKSSYHAIPYTDDFTCAACHNGATKTEEILEAERCGRVGAAIEADGGGKDYKKQMHSMCIDCHKGMNKAGETTGPTKCNDCHAR